MSSDKTPPLEDASALAGLDNQAGVRWLGGWLGSSFVICTTDPHMNDPALTTPLLSCWQVTFMRRYFRPQALMGQVS